jgi:3-hydroxyacyl-[acyl-carrier-protein] dehydratase
MAQHNMASASPETIAKIKVLLRRDLKLGNDIPIPDDMPFNGTDADFDSLDILLLVTSIEKEFKIKIASEDVGRDVFRSVATLAAYVDRESGKISPAEDYLKRLPHREPFRFVSRVNQITRGESGEGVWTLTGKEPFFAGHFPGAPLTPGVLIAEALAQLSGLVGPSDAPTGKLVHVDVRFDRPVSPPAELVLRSKLLRTVGELEQFEVAALHDNQVIARGMITLNRRSEDAGGAL